MTDELVRVLSEIQRRGGIGRGPIKDAIAHAEHFVVALPTSVSAVLDLGSGGGLPGLVVAVRRPSVRCVLVERRAKRADLLRYGVRALRLDGRVEVAEGDIDEMPHLGPVDAVTARSFGPLREVLRIASPLLRPGGVCIVSTPPEGICADVSEDFDDNGQFGNVHRWVRH
jgi:16S rRNA G527 N7-methylase RsmG